MSRSYRFSGTSPLHFVSYATVGWVDVFTRVEYKSIILDSLRYCMANKGLEIYAWCIMTNHVHLIMGTIPDVKPENVLGLHKRHTSEALHKAIKSEVAESRREWLMEIFTNAGTANSNNKGNFQLWQQHNHPIELYSREVILQKLDYLHFNPVAAGFVANAPMLKIGCGVARRLRWEEGVVGRSYAYRILKRVPDRATTSRPTLRLRAMLAGAGSSSIYCCYF